MSGTGSKVSVPLGREHDGVPGRTGHRAGLVVDDEVVPMEAAGNGQTCVGNGLMAVLCLASCSAPRVSPDP